MLNLIISTNKKPSRKLRKKRNLKNARPKKPNGGKILKSTARINFFV